MVNATTFHDDVPLFTIDLQHPLFLSLLALLAASVLLFKRQRYYNLPPGPKPHFLTGNAAEFPPTRPWFKLEEWAKEYGALATIWTQSKPTILISSARVAHDLLDNRSNIYSSRPRFAIAGDLISNDNSILFLPVGPRWRTHRKAMHSALSSTAVHKYKPIQLFESQRLAYNLLQDPDNYREAVERYTASVVLAVSYGRRVDGPHNPIVLGVTDLMNELERTNQPGRYIVEQYPWMNRLPSFLAPWKPYFLAYRKRSHEFFMSLADVVKGRMEEGTAVDSWTRYLIENQQKLGLSDEEFASLSGSIYGAGVGTTAGTLLSAILAMTTHPEASRKAQEELDRVVGSERSPTWDDEENLPYVRAYVKEVLRWRPVAVLGGTPHASTEDDVYEHEGVSYSIPKGSTMLVNLWSVNRDPEYYPEPDIFRPERFLEGSELFDKFPVKAGQLSFGFGRRSCPGEPLAKNSLFISIARLLWAFDVSHKKDINGKEIPVSTTQYSDGFNSLPLPFPCEIRPRSEAHKKVLLADYEEAVEGLQQWEP